MRTAILLATFIFMGSPVLAQQPSGDFHRLDQDHDGKLSKVEFPDPFFLIDADKDGSISPEEGEVFLHGRRGQEWLVTISPDSIRAGYDFPYATTFNRSQRLDIYLPTTPKNGDPLPIVVAVVNRGFQGPDRHAAFKLFAPLVESGDYAGVAIGSRWDKETIWPAQIHDCKAAIRWLRANAGAFNLDPERIGVTGTYSGGHLAAMLGTSGNVESLEGDLGEFPHVSSRVACVVDLFGQTDLLAMGGGHDSPKSPEARLVGGPIQENKEAARSASPITYVSADDPPFMLIHGTKDQAVPFNQSERLHAVLLKVGVESVLIPITGGEHGNFDKSDLAPEVVERMRQFFDKHLRGKDVLVSAEPIKPKKRP
jgi:acetyl esterase/lipase